MSVSSNFAFTATVEVHLPAAALKAELAKGSGGYRLKVSSPVLARSVYVSFGDVDAEVSDNYFDLLPGQAVKFPVKTAADEESLRAAT